MKERKETNKQTKKQRKNDAHVKMLLMEGGSLRRVWKSSVNDCQEAQVKDC